MRVLQQTRVNRLWERARFGESHVRSVFNAILSMLRCRATSIGYQHHDDAPAVGGPIDLGVERREQRRLVHRDRLARRDVGNVHVARVVEVCDECDLRAQRRPYRRRDARARGGAQRASRARFRIDEIDATPIARRQ